jgi:hypothetical protein
MSQYVILIYENESAYADADAETVSGIHKGHQVFAEKRGASIRAGEALQPVSTATSLRREPSGGFAVTDGAFAETKEALGGFYLIEAADLDEALAAAREIPTIDGGVEVRPVMVFDREG